MRLLGLFLFIIVVVFAKGQDTLYFKKATDTITCEKNVAIYYKVIDTSHATMEVSTYYMNGVLIVTEHFSLSQPKQYSGEYIQYFYNGNIELKGVFKDGFMDGKWDSYNKEPYYLKERAIMKESLRQGKTFLFYRSGKVMRLDEYLRDTLVASSCYDTLGRGINCDSLIAMNGESFNFNPLTYTSAEKMPSFPGGWKELLKFLEKNIKYPHEARNSGIQGKVIVKFAINQDGTISNISIIKGLGGGCTEEAIRIIKLMPKWEPATQNNIPVRVYFTMPVTFRLNGE